ncbi:MAG: 2-phosphosulfolactate phosphatase [Candidatus Dormibacteraceae bacterium]
MRVLHASGVEGARQARGLVVVIDVLRAFTVAAHALAGGARECLLVATVDEALTLAAGLPDAVVSAEVEGLPVPGIEISNSPTQIRAADLRGRTLIQRTSAGTQGVVAARSAGAILAASLVVASATAREIARRRCESVTMVAMGEDAGQVEDRACGIYMEGLLADRPPDQAALQRLLAPLRASDRYRRVMAGGWPGFPPGDLELSLRPDVFQFAMPVTREGGLLRLRALR